MGGEEQRNPVLDLFRDIVQIGFENVYVIYVCSSQFQFNWINDSVTEFYKSVRYYEQSCFFFQKSKAISLFQHSKDRLIREHHTRIDAYLTFQSNWSNEEFVTKKSTLCICFAQVVVIVRSIRLFIKKIMYHS